MKKEDKQHNKIKKKIDIGNNLVGLGMSAGIIGMLMGGMNKMFGINDDKGNLKEMVSGIVQGFLEHFEFKIDDLQDKVKELTKEKKEAEEDAGNWKQRYDEVMEQLEKKKK